MYPKRSQPPGLALLIRVHPLIRDHRLIHHHPLPL
jgi:hypothetical protein